MLELFTFANIHPQPNIAGFHKAWEQDGHMFTLTELCEGGDLMNFSFRMDNGYFKLGDFGLSHVRPTILLLLLLLAGVRSLPVVNPGLFGRRHKVSDNSVFCQLLFLRCNRKFQ
ncbi:hypothetical protein BLNAU_22408 [Blattamonas nauphoetae]|uniref:Protein kinase domain-containing protein n=1 Tax=Blattamonas nauphoetae TaxID=2049346 RepID=A0ABQ9WT57_9EUKA|nr:hypothetical protein BLNAU_22408 [Blattamonas nauphoetae]